MKKTLLLDINIWVALAFDGHPNHQIAKAWFDGLTDEVCYFCRMTQQGFLRLATNPKVMQIDALSMAEAWVRFDIFMSDPRVGIVAEPMDCEVLWRGFTSTRLFSPHVWNDAYLAAFAIRAGLELVTFDKGFVQYRDLEYTILTTG